MVYVCKLSISRTTYNQNIRELSAYVPKEVTPYDERTEARLRMRRLRERRRLQLQTLQETGELPPKNRIKKTRTAKVSETPTPVQVEAPPIEPKERTISEILGNVVWE